VVLMGIKSGLTGIGAAFWFAFSNTAATRNRQKSGPLKSQAVNYCFTYVKWWAVLDLNQ